MLPQHIQYSNGGEIAIWLLITVGALLIPIIAIAICCIRRHLSKNPPLELMDSRFPRTKMTIKQAAALRSYNGPYMESNNDDAAGSSEDTTPPPLSRTSSLKKQHVHWPDGSSSPKSGDDLRSIKDRQFSPRKQPFPGGGGDILNTAMLTESPSAHRRPAVIPMPSSALSHLIQTAIIPAGSTIGAGSASQLMAPSKQPAFFGSAGHDSIV